MRGEREFALGEATLPPMTNEDDEHEYEYKKGYEHAISHH